MNERRLIYVNILKNHYQLRAVDDNNYCCKRLEHEEVNDLLNEQQDQITNMKKERKKLKEENEWLKKELELETAKRMHIEQEYFQLKAKEWLKDD